MGLWPEGWLASLAAAVRPGERVVVLGPPGAGKSTLVADLAEALAAAGDEPGAAPLVLGVDPGQPSWGPPACASLRAPGAGGRLAFVGTLDPVRSMARWLAGVARLLAAVPPAARLLVDVPGVMRGRVAAGFLDVLLGAVRPGHVVVLGGDEPDPARLVRRLGERPGLRVWSLPRPAAAAARAEGRRQRPQRRTAALDAYLAGARTVVLAGGTLELATAPPPAYTWPGRLVGLRDAAGDTLAVGEVLAVADEEPGAGGGDPLVLRRSVTVRAPLGDPAAVRSVDLGEAGRGPAGLVVSHPDRLRGGAPRRGPTWTIAERAALPVAVAWPDGGGRARYAPRLLNPLFGDPGLLLRDSRSGRALAFDLGWPGEVPIKVLHRVGDVFLSHAHMDHAQGLVALLRSRLGPGGHVRVWGPADTLERLEGLVRAFRFDRLGAGAPRFTVHAWDGARLRVASLRCADPPNDGPVEERPAPDGVLLAEPDLTVRALLLDHGVPVLGFVCDVAAARRPLRLVYVTDVDDTPGNRAAIVAAARGADLLVCEAAFTAAHAARARETGHLTARATGEIARDADVRRLVPFHLSARYLDDPAAIYREVLAVFDRVEVPLALGPPR